MNSDQDPIELMHAVLDGEATPEQRVALDGLLAADPAARREFDALQALFETLGNAKSPAPPVGLPQRIAEAARFRSRPGGGRRSPTVFRYAASFAAGILLATLAHQLIDQPQSSDDLLALAGTMAGTPAAGTGTVSNPGLPGIEGDLTLRRSEGLLVLAVELRSPQALELVLPLSQGVQVLGVLGIGAEPPDLVLNRDRLQVLQSGRQGYAVLLRGDGTAVPYELYQGGRLIHRDAIAVPGGE